MGHREKNNATPGPLRAAPTAGRPATCSDGQCIDVQGKEDSVKTHRRGGAHAAFRLTLLTKRDKPTPMRQPHLRSDGYSIQAFASCCCGSASEHFVGKSVAPDASCLEQKSSERLQKHVNNFFCVNKLGGQIFGKFWEDRTLRCKFIK